MKIKSLRLLNFRNYERVCLESTDQLNILYGKNASGKTNLLEAISLLVEAKSFKGAREEEMISFSTNQSHLFGVFSEGGYEDEYEINLTRGKSKLLKINQELMKPKQYTRRRVLVSFSPVDLNMIKYGPVERRKYLDGIMSHFDSIYDYEMNVYRKLLMERNHLLKSSHDMSLFDIYDREIAKVGAKIIILRLKNIKLFHEYATKHYRQLSPKDQLSMTYLSTIPLADQQHEIEKIYLNHLKRTYSRDVEKRFTTIGPHRDDIDFKINQNSSKLYASQGEQRSVVLALKLAERDFIKDLYGYDPILIFDDVFSELDEKRREYFLNSLENSQVFLTTTEAHHEEWSQKNIKYFHISHGNILDS